MLRIKRDFTKWNLLILLLLFLPSTKGCLASSKLAPHLLSSRWHQASKVALVSLWCNLHNSSHYTHQWPESTRTFDLLLVLSWIVDVKFRRYYWVDFSSVRDQSQPEWAIRALNEVSISSCSTNQKFLEESFFQIVLKSFIYCRSGSGIRKMLVDIGASPRCQTNHNV